MASTATCPQCEHEDRVLRVGSASSGTITSCQPIQREAVPARSVELPENT